jgi:hypothetical protein
VFELLCEHPEKEDENELYTMRELHGKMCQITGLECDSKLYTRDYLQDLLKERYGDHIYFISKVGHEDEAHS